jgi:hypothetical protein
VLGRPLVRRVCDVGLYRNGHGNQANLWQDGRDVPDGTSIPFTEQLEKDLAAVEGCDAKIASGGGRMYVTMDRYEVTLPKLKCL